MAVVSPPIADGYRVTDAKSLVAYMVDMAWSVNEKRPNTSLAVALEVPEGQILDGPQAAKDAGLAETLGTSKLFQIRLDDLRGKDALAQLGARWARCRCCWTA